MRRLLILSAVLALAGCTKTVEEMSYSERMAAAKVVRERCAAQGVTEKSPNFGLCVKIETERDIATRYRQRKSQERARLALAAGMQGMSDSYNARAASFNQSRPVTCTSRPQSSWVGGPVSQVNTTCY